MTVYFHGSFGLNRKYMSGVLRAYLKDPKANADQVAKPFGYRAPFTGRYKSWLHKTGVVTSTRAMSLTPMGEVVWNHDPQLESLISQWFMHHELAKNPERAEAWHFFVHEFLPRKDSFTLDELEMGLAMKLMPHHPTHFGEGAPMIKVIARKIAQCYTLDEGLGQLGLLETVGAKKFSVNQVSSKGPWGSAGTLKRAYL